MKSRNTPNTFGLSPTNYPASRRQKMPPRGRAAPLSPAAKPSAARKLPYIQESSVTQKPTRDKKSHSLRNFLIVASIVCTPFIFGKKDANPNASPKNVAKDTAVQTRKVLENMDYSD